MEKDKCSTCGINDATELLTCPYQEDINNDDETLCTYCPDCQYECTMDIYHNEDLSDERTVTT